MALIRTCRTVTRAVGSAYVPGGVSCAASGRRLSYTPTLFRVSQTLKQVIKAPVVRLAASPL